MKELKAALTERILEAQQEMKLPNAPLQPKALHFLALVESPVN